MKEQISIPTSKVERASKFVKTGAKVGGNYLKFYGKKIFNPELTRETLDEENAEDIYSGLSELKGSALKVAQMLSMEKNILPTAYQEKFALSQYSAPPLSYPLVVKTFHEYFGKSPEEIFDRFSRKADHAASIGQVHEAWLDGRRLAVKIQYPGVKDSINSDLRMVRPIAAAMFNISSSEMEYYMGEVESKLIEETNYNLELDRSLEISQACSQLENLAFPGYYPELSCERILVMDWLPGQPFKEWVDAEPSQAKRNKLGQNLWNFYAHQIHNLRMVHADPHPGNFIITPEEQLGIIDFGCVKIIPDDFYTLYFQLMTNKVMDCDFDLQELFLKLGFLTATDNQRERQFFTQLFMEMIELLGQPFRNETFDFGNDKYFYSIYEMGNRLSKMKEIRNSKVARGNKHGLYINRTYFGLYNLLHALRAEINTQEIAYLSSSNVS